MISTETTVTKPRRWRRELFSRTFWRYFTVSTTPLRLSVGIALTVALAVLVLLHTGSYMADPVYLSGPVLYALSLAACPLLGAFVGLRVHTHSDRLATALSLGAAVLMPVVALTMAECLNNVFTWWWDAEIFFINYVLYLVLFGAVFVFCGRLRLPMLVVNTLLFALALTNYYVMLFRGTPFVPMDFFAATTAAGVVMTYDFSFGYQVVIALLLFLFLTLAAWKLRTPCLRSIGRIAARVFCGTLTTAVLVVYLCTDLYAEAGLKPDFWNQARGYDKTGVTLNFCLNTKYIFPQKPKGYDHTEIETYITQTVGDRQQSELGVTGTPVLPDKTPNIICIMNESLSDLSALGELQTNVDYMPYLRSLTENTIRGTLYVPVIGAGTSNTEYEFLTGLSTSFYPAGSNAYSLYIKEDLPSLVSILKAQDFSATAFHPYYSTGWNRIAVYNAFGFDRFYSLSSIIPNTILTQYSAAGFSTKVLQELVAEMYPDEQVLLRRYVSDSYDYKELIRMYESRNKDKPFHIFNVTMQNHGGYTEKTPDFVEDVYVTGVPDNAQSAAITKDITKAFPKVNQYLSLMKRSDEAFKELITYFEGVEEPTVICMFGDHQPSVENAFVRAMLGEEDLNDLPLEKEMRRHQTPFYIWANYDIPEEEIEALSINYLSSYVMKTAGVEMPAFNKYLLKLSETLPVVSTVGYIDYMGTKYSNNEKSPYTDMLKKYEYITYNYMFDEENRDLSLYTIGDTLPY